MLENRLQVRQVQRQTLTPELIKSFQLYDMPFQTLGHFVRQMTADNLFLEFDNGLMEDCTGLFAGQEADDWGNGKSCDPRDRMVYRDPCDSLQNELRLQALLLPGLSDEMRRAVLRVIESVDARGYLAEPLELLARRCGLSGAAAERALALVQGMQPCGVGARSLRECLEIQSRGSADYPLIRQILRDGSGRLERRDTAYFARLCAVSRAKIEQIFVYLASLHPFPGAGYHDDTAISYIFPDISIRRCADGLEITLSQGDSLLRLDTGYYQELRQAARHDKVSRAFVRTQYGEAREWVHILQIRQTTLSRFAHCLAEAQYAYFAQGPGYMRPLNLNQIAERMDMHPSTVCRLAKDKYIQTDWGTIQAGTLFTGAFYTEEGMIAADTVKNLLRGLVRSENPAHPASDQELAGAVERELGIQISRRTIAKYRAELGIACRRERKTTAI